MINHHASGLYLSERLVWAVLQNVTMWCDGRLTGASPKVREYFI